MFINFVSRERVEILILRIVTFKWIRISFKRCLSIALSNVIWYTYIVFKLIHDLFLMTFNQLANINETQNHFHCLRFCRLWLAYTTTNCWDISRNMVKYENKQDIIQKIFGQNVRWCKIELRRYQQGMICKYRQSTIWSD